MNYDSILNNVELDTGVLCILCNTMNDLYVVVWYHLFYFDLF